MPAGAHSALRSPWEEKELGKPDLIGMGMRGIPHAETSISAGALQQPLR